MVFTISKPCNNNREENFLFIINSVLPTSVTPK